MKKEVSEVATKDEEANEVDEDEVELEMPKDMVTLEILPNKRDCVVL